MPKKPLLPNNKDNATICVRLWISMVKDPKSPTPNQNLQKHLRLSAL